MAQVRMQYGARRTSDLIIPLSNFQFRPTDTANPSWSIGTNNYWQVSNNKLIMTSGSYSYKMTGLWTNQNIDLSKYSKVSITVNSNYTADDWGLYLGVGQGTVSLSSIKGWIHHFGITYITSGEVTITVDIPQALKISNVALLTYQQMRSATVTKFEISKIVLKV